MDMSNKKNYICVGIMAMIISGIVLEVIGYFLSKTNAIGFNFNLSPVMYVGATLVVIGFIAHFPVKFTAKQTGISSSLLDIEAIVMIVSIFIAVFLIAAGITFPVIFPENG